MKIEYENSIFDFARPMLLSDILKTADPEHVHQIMACLSGGIVVELADTVSSDCALVPITFQNEEGRRIYERTLRCVMLLAMQRLYPGKRVRIEHSIGYGIFLRLEEHQFDLEQLQKVQEEMQNIIRSDIPIQKNEWSKEKALSYFKAQRWDEKHALLESQDTDRLTVYTCDTLSDCFYGAMLPSTGYVRYFSLRLVYPGITMMMPSPSDPQKPAPYIHRPKNLSAFSKSIHSCEIMHIANADDLNRMLKDASYRHLIRLNEALHNQSLSQIADSISSGNAKAVFIAGPSSSGKTTFANRLCIHLQVLGYTTHVVSLDDFYRNKADLQPDANGEIDLEDINALDIPCLTQTISDLLSGKPAYVPTYDFLTGARSKDYKVIQPEKQQIIVFEGIHALNPLLHDGFDPSLIFRIYISELTCINIDDHNRIRTTDARLLRRMVRDYQFRNAPADETLRMWPSVRRGEEKWIFPYQEQVDCMFNSVLHYELPVLKPLAEPLLKAIQPENPNYLIAKRLLGLLDCFQAAPESIQNEIPPLSILREFIGGCTLYL